MRLIDARRDYYRRKAKNEGYRSRAAYKLIQIDNKNRILHKGAIIIDFGAAPGGWMQVASEKVGETGFVIGIDLEHIEFIRENTISIKKDIMSEDIIESINRICKKKADTIISDIAPKITGVWQIDHIRQNDLVLRILSLLPNLLIKGGTVLFKVFEGEETINLYQKIKRNFSKVIISKPPASRRQSSEIYYLCEKYENQE